MGRRPRQGRQCHCHCQRGTGPASHGGVLFAVCPPAPRPLVGGCHRPRGPLPRRGYCAAVDGVGALFEAIAVTAVFATPLAISLWALLDCVRRPAWAWALAGRRQVVWVTAILFGFLTVVGGLVIAGWYLLRVRPEIRDAEQGQISG